MERGHNSQFGFSQETLRDGHSCLNSRCDKLHEPLFAQTEVPNNLNDEASQYHGNLDRGDTFYLDESYSLGGFNQDGHYFVDAFGPYPYEGLDGHSLSHPVHETDVDYTALSDDYFDWSPVTFGAAGDIYDCSLADAFFLPLDDQELFMNMDELSDIANISSQFPQTQQNMLSEASISFPEDQPPTDKSIAPNVGHQMPTTGPSQELECVKRQVVGPRKDWKLPPLNRRGRKPKARAPSHSQKANDLSNSKARPRRSRPLEPEVKRQATLKRQNKLVCVICHFKKETCHLDPDRPDGPCLRCRSAPMPCVRYRITDAALYREQKAPFYLFSQRWKTMEMTDITEWESDEILTTQFTLMALNAPYELKVRRAVPLPGDNLEETCFVNGETVPYSIPAYGIANMKEAAASIQRMVEREVVNYLVAFVGADSTDPIIWETYATAFRRASTAPTPQERTLLFNTFRLWAFCRNISSPEHNIGEEKLGKRQSDDPSGQSHSKFPECGPVIAAQLECIYYTQFLRPLSKNVLRTLMSLLTTRDKKYWFTIYLVIFMLLHSCSMITQRDMESAAALNLS
ncbi:hypothetical protein F5X96DRAFT_431618, partial [Biscogniauxia mediterranea]